MTNAIPMLLRCRRHQVAACTDEGPLCLYCGARATEMLPHTEISVCHACAQEQRSA